MLDDPKRWQQLGEIMARERQEEARQQQQRRYAEMERTAIMNSDYAALVRQAPGKAARIYGDYRRKTAEVRDNHLIPEQGKLIEQGKIRDESLKALKSLAQQVEVAALARTAELMVRRDAAKPKIAEDDRQRQERYLLYLADKGIPAQELIERNKDDKAAMIALWDVAPIIAQSQKPQDRQAADGIREQITHIGLQGIFGPSFAEERHQELDAFAHQSHLSKLAVNQATAGVKSDGRDAPVIPDTSGTIIYNGAA